MTLFQLDPRRADERQEAKAAGIAASFVSLYGPVAELQVSQRIVMFEAEGNAAVAEAWRAVGRALARLRAAAPRPENFRPSTRQ